MDFVFSEDQDALRGAVRSFLQLEAPKEYVRRMAEHNDAGITPEMWRDIVDLGWTGLLVPEAQGGLGLGMVDAVVVQGQAEPLEAGRERLPRPRVHLPGRARQHSNHRSKPRAARGQAAGRQTARRRCEWLRSRVRPETPARRPDRPFRGIKSLARTS